MSAAPIKRGRKKAVAAPIEVEPVAPIAPPRANRANMVDLWEMRIAQMEKRALTAEAEVARMTKLYALEKLDKKGIVLALEKKQDAAKQKADAAETRIIAAKRRIESTIGRSLNNVAIDPDTGEVVDPTQE